MNPSEQYERQVAAFEARASGETPEEQRDRMTRECQDYALRESTPRVAAALRRAFGR